MTPRHHGLTPVRVSFVTTTPTTAPGTTPVRCATYSPCHRAGEQANTTDAVLHACGSCGGDKRLPVGTRRLVNAKVAYRATSPSGREYLTTTPSGAWGVPEQALAVADNRANAAGVVIIDVRTGEQWFVPKTTA